MNRETKKMFSIFSFFAFLVTFILSFMNNIFVCACMFLLSLFLFSICYILDEKKKIIIYVLFSIGVLLIVGSLVYMFMRIY